MIEAASSNSIRKSLGYSKLRTDFFNEKKREKLTKKNRFRNAGLTEPDKQNLLLQDSGRNHVSINIGTTSLPPLWVDYYEESLEKLNSLDQIMDDTAKLIKSRIKKQFGDHSDLDAQINEKATQATTILHECEEKFKQICEIKSKGSELTADQRTRENVERNLAVRIQEATIAVRKQQKGLLIKLKDDADDSRLSGSDRADMSSQELMQDMEDIAQERDGDINKLIDTINELSHLFKQMNHVVIEQGTLVDRIDYNIEQAFVETGKGKEELRKAVKQQSNKCGDYCIRTLVLMNVVFSFMLVFKFAHNG